VYWFVLKVHFLEFQTQFGICWFRVEVGEVDGRGWARGMTPVSVAKGS